MAAAPSGRDAQRPDRCGRRARLVPWRGVRCRFVDDFAVHGGGQGEREGVAVHGHGESEALPSGVAVVPRRLHAGDEGEARPAGGASPEPRKPGEVQGGRREDEGAAGVEPAELQGAGRHPPGLLRQLLQLPPVVVGGEEGRRRPRLRRPLLVDLRAVAPHVHLLLRARPRAAHRRRHLRAAVLELGPPCRHGGPGSFQGLLYQPAVRPQPEHGQRRRPSRPRLPQPQR